MIQIVGHSDLLECVRFAFLAGTACAKGDRKLMAKLENSLGSLEQKLEAVTLKLAILESAVVQKQYGQRKGYRTPYGNPYVVPQALELQPFTEENLARRLAVDVSTLIKQRKSLSEVEFEKWSRGRDTSMHGLAV